MKKMMLASMFSSALVLCPSAFGDSGQEPGQGQGGCLGCYTFVAPSKFTAETVPNPEVGLIMFDTQVGKFRGFGSNGVWQRLSNEPSINTKTASSTILLSDDIVLGNGAGIVLTLPPAATALGKSYSIKNISPSGAAIVDGYLSELIDSSLTNSLNKTNDSINITSDGSKWNIISSRKSPSVQVFAATGAATYTTPPGVLYLKVKMVGGGGAGAGSTTAAATTGNSGSSSIFGGILTAGGGFGGYANGSNGPVGGGVAIASPAVEILAVSGGAGLANSQGGTFSAGGGGGGSCLSGGGSSGGATNFPATGGTAPANSGAGGGGGGYIGGAGFAGTGGSAGGCLEAIIYNPSATYSLTVGSGGAAVGGSGAGAASSGAGANGKIMIQEYYQ